jgi:DNA-binding NarL/FixJ family response regulator
MTTTVALVEDEALVRAGLRELIDGEADLKVVGEATNGADACELVRRARPDVVVMDVRLPVIDGIEATRRIRASEHSPAILLLTTFGLEGSLMEGLRAGASGFLLKSATPEQLVDAIRVVASGDSIVSPRMTRCLIELAVERSTPPAPDLSSLSQRELDVLRLMTGGYSNAQIASELHLALPTVKSHVRHLLAKLGLRTRLQVVLAAQSAGFNPDAPR